MALATSSLGERWEGHGLVAPVDVLSEARARPCRAELDRLEARRR